MNASMLVTALTSCPRGLGRIHRDQSLTAGGETLGGPDLPRRCPGMLVLGVLLAVVATRCRATTATD